MRYAEEHKTNLSLLFLALGKDLVDYYSNILIYLLFYLHNNCNNDNVIITLSQRN